METFEEKKIVALIAYRISVHTQAATACMPLDQNTSFSWRSHLHTLWLSSRSIQVPLKHFWQCTDFVSNYQSYRKHLILPKNQVYVMTRCGFTTFSRVGETLSWTKISAKLQQRFRWSVFNHKIIKQIDHGHLIRTHTRKFFLSIWFRSIAFLF